MYGAKTFNVDLLLCENAPYLIKYPSCSLFSPRICGFSVQPDSPVRGFGLNQRITEQTDVCSVAQITLTRLSRLQCHFGIKGICLSMQTYGMWG